MPDKPSLLIVDDEPDLLSSLAGLLRREFRLHTAESGDEALELLDQHPIDVMMSDQRMPGMTGAQLLQRVSQRDDPPVMIMFTGYADIKSVIQAVNTGKLFRYVTKPWDPDDLIALLGEAVTACRRHQSIDRLGEAAVRCALLGQQIVAQRNSADGSRGDDELFESLAKSSGELLRIAKAEKLESIEA